MPDYRVKWEIDIDAKTPEEAAKMALDIQRDENSIATCFEVYTETGEMKFIDLSEE